jgi:hypothetical protein
MPPNNTQRIEWGFAALAIAVLLIGTASGSAMFLLFASCIVLQLHVLFQRKESLDRGTYVLIMVGGLTAIGIAAAMLMRR